MYLKGTIVAFELMMQETPYSRYNSGCDGIMPECRSCRFHRPYWKYQTCVFEECRIPSPPSPHDAARKREGGISYGGLSRQQNTRLYDYG